MRLVRAIYIRSIEDMLAFHCGEEVEVKAKIVDSIETPVSGKFRYVISKVNQWKLMQENQ